MKPTEQLQQIIHECGMSRYALAKRSGVAEAVLSNFMAGKRGITTDTLDRLAPALGVSIVTDKAKPRELSADAHKKTFKRKGR